MVAATDRYQASLRIEREIQIAAPLQAAYEALVEQLGPGAEMPDGASMAMKFEAWPGGRWFRDLGNDAGHLWGHVQVIKPPKLIEISGPLFMSYPAVSHLQYRLVEQGGETTLKFVHRAIGELDPEHCEGVQMGWDDQLQRVKRRAEKRS
ncbi:MAG: SRPBCC domain-containing protein [Pirellulales bacterium]